MFAKQASCKDAKADDTLHTSFEDVSHIEADYVPKRGCTRDYSMFNVDEQMLIFRECLESSEGENCAQKLAREIAKDVSKYLKFCHSEVATKPSWEVILDKTNVLQYLKKLKEGWGWGRGAADKVR